MCFILLFRPPPCLCLAPEMSSFTVLTISRELEFEIKKNTIPITVLFLSKSLAQMVYLVLLKDCSLHHVRLEITFAEFIVM